MPFVIGAVTIILAYGALEQGAVTSSGAAIVTAAAGLVAAAYFAAAPRTKAPPGNGLVFATAAAALAAALVQLVPVAPQTLQFLLPYRAEIAAASDPLAWAPLSFAPAHTFRSVIRLAAGLLLLLLARDLSWRNWTRPWPLFVPLLLIASGEAILGLFQFFSSGSSNPARGTYANRDHFSGLLELAIPVAVALALAAYSHGQKRFETLAGDAVAACALLALATLMTLAVVFSLSRMGFLCALASLFTVGAAHSSARGPRRWRWLSLTATAALVLAALFVLPTNDLIIRFAAVGSGELNADARAQIWRESIPLIASSPWLGSGLGAYESAFLRFKHVAPMQTVSHAHNDYLQGLAEGGLIGVLPILLLAALAVRAAWQAASLPSEHPLHFLGVGCSGAILAGLLHSLVDFNFYIPENAFFFAWTAGIALGTGAAVTDSRKTQSHAIEV